MLRVLRPLLPLIAAEPVVHPAGLISNLTESAPALRSVQASPRSVPVYGQRPFGPPVLPEAQGFLPYANRRYPGFAIHPGREPERRDSCRARYRLPWENAQRSGDQSRRGKDVGVVLQEAFGTRQSPANGIGLVRRRWNLLLTSCICQGPRHSSLPAIYGDLQKKSDQPLCWPLWRS